MNFSEKSDCSLVYPSRLVLVKHFGVMNKMSKEPVKKCDKISKDEIMNYMTGSNKHINILVEAAHQI